VVTTAGAIGPDSRTPPPIGRPIAGLGVRLLDRDLRPVPAGVPGELCVAGRGLARGYRGRPAATAEVFVPDPAGGPSESGPGARLYRTGDLARWLPDGRIEFLGRIDTQVQVRGFRVELGEIEAVLAEHPAVASAVVLAAAGDDGPRLTAYVAPADGAPPAVEEIRAWLAGRLSDYMLPGAFAVLDAIPLNHNGKVDRAALAGLRTTSLGLGAACVAPRSELEATLCRLWGEVLARPAEEIGVHHGFFHLGGHSLLATRLVSRLRAELGVELPLATFFEGPTVAELAEALEVMRWAATGGASGAAEPADTGGEIEEGEL
jgi:acyl carrier protein